MRLIDSRAEYLAKYLKTETAKVLASWDGRTEGSEPNDVRVYCILGWRDITRALSAAQLIEREMRRGAKAYRDAYGSAGGHGSLISSPEWFLQNLGKGPQPVHTNVSGLEIVELAGPPLAFHLKPTTEAFSALDHAIASQVGYTMAGFGQPFTVEWITGRNLRPGDLELASVTRFVERRQPAFEVTSQIELRAEDLDKTYYQAVSRPPEPERLDFQVHLVVQRVCGGQVDLIHASY